MNVFDSADVAKDVKEEKDFTGNGGGFTIPSNVYNMTIKHAYAHVAQSGAIGLTVQLQTPDNKSVKDVQWMVSGDKKGNRTYYMVKDKNNKETGEKANLPGFSMADSLALLVAGKSIVDLPTTKKSIMLYSYDEGKDVPTEVDMFMDLVGKEVKAGVLLVKVDKKKKSDATGKYVPTGETKEENQVDKYFRARDSMTTTEIRAGLPEPVFINTWLEKWEGVVKEDFSKEAAANTGTAGLPTGQNAPADNMFASGDSDTTVSDEVPEAVNPFA